MLGPPEALDIRIDRVGSGHRCRLLPPSAVRCMCSARFAQTESHLHPWQSSMRRPPNTEHSGVVICHGGIRMLLPFLRVSKHRAVDRKCPVPSPSRHSTETQSSQKPNVLGPETTSSADVAWVHRVRMKAAREDVGSDRRRKPFGSRPSIAPFVRPCPL